MKTFLETRFFAQKNLDFHQKLNKKRIFFVKIGKCQPSPLINLALHVTTFILDSCGYLAFASASRNILQSPNWPDEYARNLTCTWTLVAPPEKQVELLFIQLSTEKCCDAVRVSLRADAIIYRSCLNII